MVSDHLHSGSDHLKLIVTNHKREFTVHQGIVTNHKGEVKIDNGEMTIHKLVLTKKK